MVYNDRHNDRIGYMVFDTKQMVQDMVEEAVKEIGANRKDNIEIRSITSRHLMNIGREVCQQYIKEGKILAQSLGSSLIIRVDPAYYNAKAQAEDSHSAAGNVEA